MKCNSRNSKRKFYCNYCDHFSVTSMRGVGYCNAKRFPCWIDTAITPICDCYYESIHNWYGVDSPKFLLEYRKAKDFRESLQIDVWNYKNKGIV